MKNYLILLALVLFSCPQPPPIDLKTVQVEQLSIGQEAGSIVVTWVDPDIEALATIEIATKQMSSEEVVDLGQVAKGVERYVVPKEKVKIGETYLIEVVGLTVDGESTAEVVMPHTVASVSLAFEVQKFYDLYADFSFVVDGDYSQLTVKWDGGVKNLSKEARSCRITSLVPGKSYQFQFMADEQVIAVSHGEMLLFWDDFEEVSDARWIWANKENPNVGSGHWTYSQTGTNQNTELKTEDSVNFLRLKATRNEGSRPDNKNLIGSGIRSNDKFYFTFGKVEIRIRFKNNDNGSFPATWLMPQFSPHERGGEWPYGGEIDIMERVHKLPGVITQTIHTAHTYGPTGATGGNPSWSTVDGKGAGGKAEDWHTWNTVGLDWTKDGLQWLVNGIKTKWFPYNESIDVFPFTKDSAFYLILNMSVTEASGFAGTAATGFYNHMDVDYVKVSANADTVLLEGDKVPSYYKNFIIKEGAEK